MTNASWMPNQPENPGDGSILTVREYGRGPDVIVLHGGPGAAGYMAPVAARLGDSFHVLEPFQRAGGDKPITVAAHVGDLHELVRSRCSSRRPAIVGHSWGAMLALAYAAEHPDAAAGLVLVGCGTFDLAARARFKAVMQDRMTDDMRRRLDDLDGAKGDAGRLMLERVKVIDQIYTFEQTRDDAPSETFFDERAHRETWQDMLRLQADGVYPAAFDRIRIPAVMMHGSYDPHPGEMIHATLRAHMPQLEFIQWERCGHYPWRERFARDEFFASLRDWLCKVAVP